MTKTYITSSDIHGIGLFALVDIDAGVEIIKFEGHDSLKWSPYIIHIGDRLFEVTNDAKDANHSLAPSAMVSGESLFAIDDIKKGDEITFDYGYDITRKEEHD